MSRKSYHESIASYRAQNGKKCPQNRVNMAQKAGTRARESVDKDHMLESRSRSMGRQAGVHPRAPNEMCIKKGGFPHLFGVPPTLLGLFLSPPPLSTLILADNTHSLACKNLRSWWGSIFFSPGQFGVLAGATRSSNQPLQGDWHKWCHLTLYSASILGCAY